MGRGLCNKTAYIRHMYSGKPKSRKKVEVAIRRHYGITSPQDHQQLYSRPAASRTYSRRIKKNCSEAIACSSSLNEVESVTKQETEQEETLDIDWPEPDDQIVVSIENEDSLQADDGNEIKVFCPKCNAYMSHTAEELLQHQIKIIIAKVYHYFEQEYEELKIWFDGLELSPMSKFRQRTALATGVSETTVLEILQEEARRNAEVREEQSQSERHARKRPRQTDSSSDDSDNNEDGDDEQSRAVHDEEPEIYVELPKVKDEPCDEPCVSGANDPLADPISTRFKTQPRNEEDTFPLADPISTGFKTQPRNEEDTSMPRTPTPDGRKIGKNTEEAMKKALQEVSQGRVVAPKFFLREKDYKKVGDMYHCARCDKIYSEWKSLREHVKLKHYNFPKHKCSVCKEPFMSLDAVTVHKLKEHNVDDRVQCNLCNKIFNTKWLLANHINKTHMAGDVGRRYKCEFCDYVAFKYADMYKHKFKHKTVKDFHCKFCKKSFVRKQTLNLHERIHTDDRRKVCNVCGQAFVQKASLNYHMTKYHPGVSF